MSKMKFDDLIILFGLEYMSHCGFDVQIILYGELEQAERELAIRIRVS
jgi:hypothetical protein